MRLSFQAPPVMVVHPRKGLNIRYEDVVADYLKRLKFCSVDGKCVCCRCFVAMCSRTCLLRNRKKKKKNKKCHKFNTDTYGGGPHTPLRTIISWPCPRDRYSPATMCALCERQPAARVCVACVPCPCLRCDLLTTHHRRISKKQAAAARLFLCVP